MAGIIKFVRLFSTTTKLSISKKKTRDLVVGDVIYSGLKIDANKTTALGISKQQQTGPASTGGTVNVDHPMLIVEKNAAANTAKGVLLSSKKPRHTSLTADQQAALLDASTYMTPTKPSHVLPQVFSLSNPDDEHNVVSTNWSVKTTMMADLIAKVTANIGKVTALIQSKSKAASTTTTTTTTPATTTTTTTPSGSGTPGKK